MKGFFLALQRLFCQICLLLVGLNDQARLLKHILHSLQIALGRHADLEKFGFAVLIALRLGEVRLSLRKIRVRADRCRLCIFQRFLCKAPNACLLL